MISFAATFFLIHYGVGDLMTRHASAEIVRKFAAQAMFFSPAERFVLRCKVSRVKRSRITVFDFSERSPGRVETSSLISNFTYPTFF